MDRHTPARYELLYTQTRTGHLFRWTFYARDVSEFGQPDCALSRALVSLYQQGLIDDRELFSALNMARSLVFGGVSVRGCGRE